MEYDVFISYSWSDSKTATKIYDKLSKLGFSCCFDRDAYHGGSDFPQKTATNIINSRVFLYLGSKNSFNSGWAPDEVAFAKAHKKRETLLFYAIDEAHMPEWMELAFGAINRRNYKEHPVDTVLANDIRQILNIDVPHVNPKKHNEKGCTIAVSVAFVCILFALIPSYFIYYSKDTLKNTSQSCDSLSDSIGQHYDEVKAVDLGLSSSTLWADRNIGANSSIEYGDYYGWGEIQAQTEQSIYNFPTINSTSLVESEYNIAKMKFGPEWNIPTPEQWKELKEECVWNWTTIDGIHGYKVTGKNKNFIFLPASGRIAQDRTPSKMLLEVGKAGYYWSSVLSDENAMSVKAHLTNFHASKVDVNATGVVETGRSIRAVCTVRTSKNN